MYLSVGEGLAPPSGMYVILVSSYAMNGDSNPLHYKIYQPVVNDLGRVKTLPYDRNYETLR